MTLKIATITAAAAATVSTVATSFRLWNFCLHFLLFSHPIVFSYSLWWPHRKSIIRSGRFLDWGIGFRVSVAFHGWRLTSSSRMASMWTLLLFSFFKIPPIFPWSPSLFTGFSLMPFIFPANIASLTLPLEVSSYELLKSLFRLLEAFLLPSLFTACGLLFCAWIRLCY